MNLLGLGKYPSITPNAFLAWAELARYMGVSHIVLYNHSLGASLQTILDEYVKEGFFTVHQVPGHPELPFEKPSRYTGPWDCMLRYGNAYNFMMNIDTDEMIVPQNKNHSLIDMLSSFEKMDGGYCFQNSVFFLPERVVSITPSVLLKTIRGKDISFNPKCIWKLPSKCTWLGPHRCKSFTKKEVWRISTEVAKSHHFKQCTTARQKFACSRKFAVMNNFLTNRNIEIWEDAFSSRAQKYQ